MYSSRSCPDFEVFEIPADRRVATDSFECIPSGIEGGISLFPVDQFYSPYIPKDVRFYGRGGLTASGVDILNGSISTYFVFNGDRFLGHLVDDVLLLFTHTPELSYSPALAYSFFSSPKDLRQIKKIDREIKFEFKDFFSRVSWLLVPTVNLWYRRSHVTLLLCSKVQEDLYQSVHFDSTLNPLGSFYAARESARAVGTNVNVLCQYSFTKFFGRQSILASGHWFSFDRRCGVYVFGQCYFLSRLNKVGATQEFIQNCADMVCKMIYSLPESDMQVILNICTWDLGVGHDENIIENLTAYCETHNYVGPYSQYFSLHGSALETRTKWLPFFHGLSHAPHALIARNQLAYFYKRMITLCAPRSARAHALGLC